MEEKIEIWKDITGYEGRYKISNLGQVKSLERLTEGKNGYSKLDKERILKPHLTPHGYIQVCLFKECVRWYPLVHRLISLAFLENPNNYPQINHINGIKSDNRLENLEWCTQSQNMLHAIATGLQVHQKGSERFCAKLSENIVSEIKKLIKEGVKLKDIALEYKVGPVAISNIKTGRTWKHV